MIKQILCLLVAIVCCVAAAPNPLNVHPEVANLSPDQVETFSAFCFRTPNLVRQNIVQSGRREFATHVLDILYHSADQIGLEPYKFQPASAEQLASKIRDSDKNYADLETTSMNQMPSEEKFAYLALYGLLEHTKNAASRETLTMLDKYREVFGATNMRQRLEEACQLVNDLEGALSTELKLYLQQVSANLETGLADVPCTTSQKVRQLNGICRFVMQAPKAQNELTYVPIV